MATDHAGATPLHYAAASPVPWARSTIMRQLLEQGSAASQVDVDATDSSGMTALHWSAGICLVNIGETLVKPGVNGKIRM